jgi:predicted transcriptional regulator
MNEAAEPGPQMNHRFFHATGLVMIFGTLMAGAITLSIASNMAEIETKKVFASNIADDQAVFETARELVIPVLDVELQ